METFQRLNVTDDTWDNCRKLMATASPVYELCNNLIRAILYQTAIIVMRDQGRLFSGKYDWPSTASSNIRSPAIQRIGSAHCGTPSRCPKKEKAAVD